MRVPAIMLFANTARRNSRDSVASLYLLALFSEHQAAMGGYWPTAVFEVFPVAPLGKRAMVRGFRSPRWRDPSEGPRSRTGRRLRRSEAGTQPPASASDFGERRQINKVGLLARATMLWFCLILSGLAADLSQLPPPTTRPVDFAKDIAPIFESHCLKCHGPDKQRSDLRLDQKASAFRGGSELGPAIIPGKSDQSPLIHLVAGLVPDKRMPAKGDPLSPDLVGLLRAWIDQGAAWPDNANAAPAKPAHWAFTPVNRPVPPSVPGALSSRNPVDQFIGARLAIKDLTLSPEADRRTLIRRLYLDLTGLPPAPEEVTAFERDSRPDAYERLVERLLASPRFGERWARHWLDVARYTETHGFEMNNPRPNAWPYRDYVIHAFNDDKPYDQFVREQLAGDILGADVATGFLVAGPWDQVKSPDVVLTSNQRADELHDIVSTTSSAFLGLTVGCARCHDHKFDPIPQRDYYALKAAFEGVQHGERPRFDGGQEAKEHAAATARARLAVIDASLAGYEPLAQTGALIDTNRLRAPVSARLNRERFAPVTARRLRFTISATTGSEPCLDELEVFTTGPNARNIALASAGTTAKASGTFAGSDLHKLEHLNDGRYGNSRSWISNEAGRGRVELGFPKIFEIDRVTWGRDREGGYKDRLITGYQIEVTSGDGAWKTVASSADRRSLQAGGPSGPEYPTNGLAAADAARLNGLLSERNNLQAELARLSARPMVYAGEFKMPPDTRRFYRGDPMQPREVIEPGVLSRISFPASTVAPQAAGQEPARRLRVAEWIVSPANPLTARVIVNRLWLYHFGEGLVATPSDFGLNGAKPTHPELLDWLAAELMSPGTPGVVPWSLKHIHRLIVTSASYRQSSMTRPDGLAADAGARFLWRFPARRLEAEPLRDSILAVAGKLDLRMGGPGWSPFVPNENYVRVYVPKQEFGPADFRRMVYASGVRQRPDGVFGAFDCPDGGQIAPKRGRSTTPLQALNLLNSGFMLQAAGFFADRLEHESGSDANAQARRAFALAFNREPAPDELAAARELIHAQGLKIFCRALLNANEFAYIF